MMKYTSSRAFMACCCMLLITIAFPACKGTQYTPANLPERQLSFGDGGGFAGAYTEYVLLENGQLFMQKGFGSEWTEMPAAKKSQAKGCFRQADLLLTDSAVANYPGNIYHFVQLKDTGREVRVTWGAPGYQVKEDIKMLHEKLSTLSKTEAPEK